MYVTTPKFNLEKKAPGCLPGAFVILLMYFVI